MLFKPIKKSNDYVSRRVLFSVTDGYPQDKSYQPSQDEYNIFLYSKHFRVIYGADYNESEEIGELASNILSVAEEVWAKEVDEFGFNPPKNSDNYYLDIYIGNRSSYNKAYSQYENISGSYAGYATSYLDGTAYFVLNPFINSGILKVTIAHEFFHTIQYGYGLDSVNDEIWYKNIWFLEASAVMMEDEVFDYVNDYVNYIKNYFDNTSLPLEYQNGNIEYGKVVFAQFLQEKYGMNLIKEIFEKYDKKETILQDIFDRVKEMGIDTEDMFLTYGKWIAEKNSYFKDGVEFPEIKKYDINENFSMGYCGLTFFDSDENGTKYIYGDNPSYAQATFDGERSILANISEKGLVVVNLSSFTSLSTRLLRENRYDFLRLKTGWNLIGNIFDADINPSDILRGRQILWRYQDGEYKAFSKDVALESRIEKLGYKMDDMHIKGGEGFWIYSPFDANISLSLSRLKNPEQKYGEWSMVSFDSAFSPENLDKNITIVWEYSDDWRYYSKKYDINISKIDFIVPSKGYFTY